MKILIAIVIGLLVVGCGKTDAEQLEEENKRLKTQLENNKQKAEFEADNKKLEEEILRLIVVGTYEVKKDEDTHREVFLASGIVEGYTNGDKHEEEGKWTISKDGEIHIIDEGGGTEFLRINKDRFSGVLVSSITSIAKIVEGKRTDYPKDKQQTWKKIK